MNNNNKNLYDGDEEKLLSLSLGGTDDVSDIDEMSKKRKRTTIVKRSSIISLCMNKNNSYECHESFESKVLRLIRTREEMLNRRQGQAFDINTSGSAGGLRLIHLLLLAAAASAKGCSGGRAGAAALESLRSLYSGASPAGDSVQRVAAHFADALAARLLLTRKSPFIRVIMKGPTAEEELSAFTALYRASPLFQFAHFTANQAILEALGDSLSAHVVDFDVSYGFQWPSLIQSLADQNRTTSLRITGFGTSTARLRETEQRLVSFAKGFRNLSFEFRGLLIGLGEDPFCGLIINENETLAVNLVLHDNNYSTTLLDKVRSLNPVVVVLVEQELMSSSPSFVARFVESLHYFAAMFDSLDDSLPSDSAERLSIEKNHLGAQIKGLLNQDIEDLSRRRLSTVPGSWRERMKSNGFRRVKMSSKSVIQAKLLLKMRTNSSDQYGGDNGVSSNFCGGFRVCERDEGMAISLGWQNRYLITASAWQ